MEHLGERLSALVDGELGHAERDRALAHLASCETCRFEAEMLRRLKRRLHGLDGPEPSTDLMGRLSALKESSTGEPPLGPPAGPSGGHGPLGTHPSLGSSRPIGGGLPGTPHGGHPAAEPEPARGPVRRSATPLSLLRPPWGRTRYAVAGASVVALALGTAFVAGDEREGAPVVRPALEQYEVEHAVVSGQAPDLGPPEGDEGGGQRALDGQAPDDAATPR
ncbi:anti-sigma factor family protein [Halostreptopolyspora alba]|uniref:Zf-HC2 domain-containing protein n=1 Tax=Halostreptopolyspora alba TaxID=2487137 RepID=A0A3N0DRE3_9ACTN|nr:zf-HC2 domain-containing protein [Nocardiopsaceae bacterium YIM 96095]